MNLSPKNSMTSAAAAQTVEATLRQIANLPTPEGLEDRVQAVLHSAPRTARFLIWPTVLHAEQSAYPAWMRAAAAAAIVFVIAGGGWGVYSHVQQGQPGRAVVLPPRVQSSGGFSSAGAMRTPDTLDGPVVASPVEAKPETKPLKKPGPGSAAAHPVPVAAPGKDAEHGISEAK